jgi:hypothetical protein
VYKSRYFELNRIFITNSLHENLLALMFVPRVKMVKYLESYRAETCFRTDILEKNKIHSAAGVSRFVLYVLW